MQKRCSWVNEANELYVKYHDEEWGVGIHDDNRLFEMLSLEIFQAGLSWEIVLNKRENFRKVFDNFILDIVASYDDKKIEELTKNNSIIRHKLKIKAIVKNANIFLNIQRTFGSFDTYLWSFKNSDDLAKDLKQKGMSFIGKTTIESFMEAVGIINSHELGCFKHNL